MTQEQLGLFDTPPSRTQIRSGIAIIGLMYAGMILTLPVSGIPLRVVDAFIPIIDTAMFVSQLITATLLYAMCTVFRSRALAVLASGYVFGALMLIPHVLTFPGAFAAGGLLGAGFNTTGWIAIFWRAGFPIAVLCYVALNRSDAKAQPGTEWPATRIGSAVLAAAVLAAALTLLATSGHDLLPPIMYDLREGISANLALVQSLVIAINAVAVAVLFRARRSALDIWLLVSLAIWLAQLLLSVVTHSRYSLGFYSMYAMMLVSQLILMLALIAESFRLQMRLALATSARTREREARLMSTDAVTAAISHEIGQPLTSALLSARAGLKWLNRPSPDLEMVDRSLRDTIDSGHRTFAVVKSIRAVFGKGTAPAIEVSLNDLVRETAALLNRELASGKVSLELELDEALPPVMADRVQIQRVLVNLFINAIESLSATRGQPRRIAIRSVSLDGEDVLLEVSDTGIGVAPEEVEHIFDAFVTTKTTGTGLGLSLCRTIVEEHYGRLWASPGADCGVTFHLKLPRSGGVPLSLQ